MRSVIALLFVALMATSSDAQLLGRRRSCTGFVPSHSFGHNQFAVPYVPDQGNTTVVINNATPAPIGGAGNTLFGYPSAGTYAQQFNYGNNAAFTLDPGQLMREAARLTSNAQDLHRDALTNYQTTADQLANQAMQNQRIAALTSLLDNVGVGDLLTGVSSSALTQRSNFAAPSSQGSQTLGSGSCLRICPDGNGGLMISIDDGSGQQLPSASTLANSGAAIFETKCLGCHGASSDIPFIDTAGNLSMSAMAIDKAIRLAESGAMPPSASGQALSDDEFLAFKNWIIQHQ